ncbi:MAG: hypothetical protein R3B70_16955 [Polyangiaceae bacterium]
MKNIDGARNLFAQLRRNPVGFDDFRFELHLAGALARSQGQSVLRVAGDRAGPDIEAQTRSGHRCGFACYRASSEPPAIAALRESTNALVRYVSPSVVSIAAGDQLLAIDFSAFPLRPTDSYTVRELVREILRRPEVPRVERGGITITRFKLPPGTKRSGDITTVRLRLQFCVPSWDRQRIQRKTLEKVAQESTSWASSYTGVPIFAVQESKYGQDAASLASAVLASPNPFVGVMSIFPAVIPHANGTFHGLEDIQYQFRPNTGGARVHVALETFGDNIPNWSEGHVRIGAAEESAHEDWDISHRARGKYVECTQALTVYRAFSRVPLDPAQNALPRESIVDTSLRLIRWEGRDPSTRDEGAS